MPMMFRKIAILAMIYQGLSYAPADVVGSGTEAVSADWSSWSVVMGSLSAPLALRLAVWLVLGCGVGICLSFFVRNLRRGRALVGGALGGLLAAGGFFMAVQPVGEMVGHLLAAAILGLGMALMITLARVRRAEADGMKPVAKSKSASGPAPVAAKQLASAPKPAPKPAPAAQSSSAPSPDPKPAPAAQSSSAPAPETQDEAAEESAPDPDPESESAPAADSSSPPPKAEAAPKASKQPRALPTPKKTKPKKAKAGSGADWLQDHG